MTAMIETGQRLGTTLNRLGVVVLPLLARLVFAGVLLGYFWSSARTKLGDGLFGVLNPSDGAYAQIFPKAFEAVGYDSSQFGLFHWAVATAGTLAEFVLPALIVLGLLTRLASLGMIGFVFVQSLTDVFGHDLAAEDRGSWFDSASDALLLDQRAFWVFVLLVPLFMGAGRVSLDALFFRANKG
jgi:putative oxidoreductase